MRIAKPTLYRSIISFSTISLVLLLLSFLFPITFAPTNAEEVSPTRSADNVSLSVSAPQKLIFNLIPTADGNLQTESTHVAVSTNNENGYSVYVSANNDEAALVSHNSKYPAKITNLASDTTAENFPLNSWGYNLESENGTSFHPIPTSSTEALIQTGVASQDVLTINFGIKIDSSLPSGEYSNAILISAISNPPALTTLSSVNTMQEVTPEICVNSAEHETKRLFDTRDGQYYWVAKLKDGNCWMTQNLALDFDGTTALNSTSSNVATGSSFIAPQTQKVVPIAYASASYNTTRNWNLGKYVMSTPTKLTACRASGSSITNASVLEGGTLSSCVKAGYVDVSGLEWQPTFVAHEEEINGVSTFITVDESAHTYDAHYLAGNYYPYNAATAGVGGSLSNKAATSSICPKNWMLPRGNTNEKGSFYYLFDQYGLTTQSNNSTTGYNIYKSPLHFTTNGAVDVRNGVLFSSWVGYYWTRQASALAGANNQNSTLYALTLHNKVTTNTAGYRYEGYQMRCLVLTD